MTYSCVVLAIASRCCVREDRRLGTRRHPCATSQGVRVGADSAPERQSPAWPLVQAINMPPFASMTTPVAKEAPSDARKAATAAISREAPKRPAGMSCIAFSMMLRDDGRNIGAACARSDVDDQPQPFACISSTSSRQSRNGTDKFTRRTASQSFRPISGRLNRSPLFFGWMPALSIRTSHLPALALTCPATPRI